MVHNNQIDLLVKKHFDALFDQFEGYAIFGVDSKDLVGKYKRLFSAYKDVFAKGKADVLAANIAFNLIVKQLILQKAPDLAGYSACSAIFKKGTNERWLSDYQQTVLEPLAKYSYLQLARLNFKRHIDSILSEDLHQAGLNVLYCVNVIIEKHRLSDDEKEKLTYFLNSTKNLISVNPDKSTLNTDLSAFSKEINNISGIDRSWSRTLVSAAICMLGVILCVASMAIFLATAGISAPFSVAGLSLGVNLLAAGISGGLMTGSIAVATGFGLFSRQSFIGELATAANALSDLISKQVV